MTAGLALAGASYQAPVDWHAIDWQKAHRNVRRLQVRRDERQRGDDRCNCVPMSVRLSRLKRRSSNPTAQVVG
jgi:hypothetical protein